MQVWLYLIGHANCGTGVSGRLADETMQEIAELLLRNRKVLPNIVVIFAGLQWLVCSKLGTDSNRVRVTAEGLVASVGICMLWPQTKPLLYSVSFSWVPLLHPTLLALLD